MVPSTYQVGYPGDREMCKPHPPDMQWMLSQHIQGRGKRAGKKERGGEGCKLALAFVHFPFTWNLLSPPPMGN